MDWVKARSACSSKRVFETLYEVVESDVKSANALNNLAAKFHVTHHHKKIIVSREEEDGDAVTNIVFELSPGAITVKQGPDKPLFSARPRLSETGECLLEVDGTLYQLWQVSQKALEDLFFA